MAAGALSLVVLTLSFGFLVARTNDFLQHSALRALNTSFTDLTGGNYALYPQRFAENYTLLSLGIGEFVFSPAEAAALVPQAVARLLFSPFPDTLYRSPRLALALPLALFNLALAPFVIAGLWRGIRLERWIFGTLGLHLALMAVSIGLHCANAGTAIRLRDMVMPIYLLFAAIGAGARMRRDNVFPHISGGITGR